MGSALIGQTGFVGGNIALSHRFDACFNTSNLAELAGRRFDLVVCAAGRADAYRINQAGEADRAELARLVDSLSKTQIGRLVLISTVCVYPSGSPDETAPLSPAGLRPYGANRLWLERELGRRFETLVVRLPQLYGARLRKGVVFDLLGRRRIEHIDPDGRFQLYGLSRLWADIETALAAGWDSLNAATPPLRNGDVARAVFGLDIEGQKPAAGEPPWYSRDMRTAHAAGFGGPAGYLMTAEQSLAALRDYATAAGGELAGS
ncbi:MAG: NAD-dependent epimerase/dehydratase family protein [Propionibacteriaceae bacterium]|jgi:hypothetical protein|nr:NAD-dependent epimerase/dehydratase family protein [Propionibacteriaceae bacterium]